MINYDFKKYIEYLKIPEVEIPEEGGSGGANLRPGCIFL